MIKSILKNKTVKIVLIGVLAGLCLIFAGSLNTGNKAPSVNEGSSEYPSEELNVYTEQLEGRVKRIIENISGVSNAEVLITFASSNENVYASSGSNSDFVIIENSDGSESGIKLMEINAKVRGIAVVCDYGGNEALRGDIIELLTSLFDIGSNKVSVMPSK